MWDIDRLFTKQRGAFVSSARGSVPWPSDDFTALHFRKGKCTHACAEHMPEAGGRAVEPHTLSVCFLSLPPLRVGSFLEGDLSYLVSGACVPSPPGPPRV